METRNSPATQPPNLYCHEMYSQKEYINIVGDYNYIKEKILKYSVLDGFYPGWNIKSLGNDMYDISEAKKASEPQFFVAKYLPFKPHKADQEVFEFELSHFYLTITKNETK